MSLLKVFCVKGGAQFQYKEFLKAQNCLVATGRSLQMRENEQSYI